MQTGILRAVDARHRGEPRAVSSWFTGYFSRRSARGMGERTADTRDI